ncbi:serine/threonine-protein kinase [Curtobacterium ammoniigenes]|uniref:serine/threonine-protein kinase n=1 Tax=Curtobacterium ammoniigenes TaxID=395387 RepID=UPI0008325A56|nr:serine/threonine-protein kinase [Curtobacterium ammoniigenes]
MSLNETDGSAPLLAGRYALGEVLGRGGMSTVYRARDTVLGRQVAVKLLNAASSDPTLVRRGRSEIAAMSALGHHALVTLFDADAVEYDGEERTYLVMELVDGPTLDRRIERGPIGAADLRQMTLDLVEALHIVHAAALVHRDIKPANILLAPTHVPGREFAAKLGDFGIASVVDGTRVTATGTIIGTAAYLSPEQALGKPVGPAADVYALGLVLLEAATGTRAFPGPLMESITARLTGDPVIPGTLGTEWGSLLTAMTARDPEARPTTEQILARLGTPPAAEDMTVPLAAADATVPLAAAEATVPFAAAAAPSSTVAPEATVPLSAVRSTDSAAEADDTTLLPTPVEAAEAPWWRRPIALVVGGAALLAIVVLSMAGLGGAFGSGGSALHPSTSPSATPAASTTSATAAPATPTAPPSTAAPAVPVSAAPAPAAPAPAQPAPGNGHGNGNGNGKGNGKGNGGKHP